MSPAAPSVRFLPVGDTALNVEFGTEIDLALSEQVVRLRAALDAAELAGVIETVPTFRSLMVHYDPLQTEAAALTEQIRPLLGAGEHSGGTRRVWRVPVCYEGDCAPDLAEVAERTGMSPADVVALHTQAPFHVYMIGFMPGFGYMGDLPPVLQLPRRSNPRVRVPPGSVAIALAMTGIYPVESPGGWHLLGATPIRLFNPDWERPSLFATGDGVHFQAIDRATYEAIKAEVADGRYQVPSEERAR